MQAAIFPESHTSRLRGSDAEEEEIEKHSFVWNIL